MRKIEFTSIERKMLKPLLNKRLKSFEEFHAEQVIENRYGAKRFEKSHVIPMRLTIALVSNTGLNTFSARQKLLITSCLNEYISMLESGSVLPSQESWLTMSEKQKRQLMAIDGCKDILQKIGYFSERYADKSIDRNFRYSHVFEHIEKLKRSEKILLAGVQRNDCYRVTFISDEKEFCDFEIKYSISLDGSPLFRKLNGKTVEELAKEKSSVIATRNQAKVFLSGYNRDYNAGSLAIMQKILA